MQDQYIHIALATDDNYVSFAMIVIQSISRFHPATGKPILVHLLTNGLNPVQRKRLQEFHPAGITIREEPVDAVAFAKRWDGYNKPTFYRLELEERLPDVDRIIYLDCDMVVLDDIEKLWNTDLQGKSLGAVGDRAGLQEKRNYYAPNGKMFNAGMLLIDLKQWRENGETVRLCKYWNERKDMRGFLDQGLLNALFYDRYFILHQRWNIINSVYRNPPLQGVYTEEDVREAIRHPGIVHFTGHHKPWKFWKRFHHPYGYTFCRMALQTPVEFSRKLICWLKLHLNGFFVGAKKKVPWGKKDVQHFDI